jgi:hypothetical protein
MRAFKAAAFKPHQTTAYQSLLGKRYTMFLEKTSKMTL